MRGRCWRMSEGTTWVRSCLGTAGREQKLGTRRKGPRRASSEDRAQRRRSDAGQTAKEWDAQSARPASRRAGPREEVSRSAERLSTRRTGRRMVSGTRGFGCVRANASGVQQSGKPWRTLSSVLLMLVEVANGCEIRKSLAKTEGRSSAGDTAGGRG